MEVACRLTNYFQVATLDWGSKPHLAVAFVRSKSLNVRQLLIPAIKAVLQDIAQILDQMLLHLKN